MGETLEPMKKSRWCPPQDLNLLSFGLHTLMELADGCCRLLHATVGARRRIFPHLEALTTYWPFESWERLVDFMMRGLAIGPYAVQ